MPGLVVGIFPVSDPAAIHNALEAQQIDLSKVKVVSRADATPVSEESPIDFLTVEENMESNSRSDDMTKGTGIMSDSGGTSVPGIGGSGPSLGSFQSRSAAAGKSYLGALAIPGDEADNFNEAIEQGRAVVAYPDASGDATSVATAFKAAGLRNVRVY